MPETQHWDVGWLSCWRRSVGPFFHADCATRLLSSLTCLDASPPLRRTMSNVSADVLWSCIKDQSCHLLKRRMSQRSGMGKNGGHFTLEPNNLTGINSFKYSGLANAKTVGIEPAKDGKGIVLTTKSRKDAKIRKPAKMSNKTTLAKTFRKTAKTLISQTSGNFYRADLESGTLLPLMLLLPRSVMVGGPLSFRCEVPLTWLCWLLRSSLVAIGSAGCGWLRHPFACIGHVSRWLRFAALKRHGYSRKGCLTFLETRLLLRRAWRVEAGWDCAWVARLGRHTRANAPRPIFFADPAPSHRACAQRRWRSGASLPRRRSAPARRRRLASALSRVRSRFPCYAHYVCIQ